MKATNVVFTWLGLLFLKTPLLSILFLTLGVCSYNTYHGNKNGVSTNINPSLDINLSLFATEGLKENYEVHFGGLLAMAADKY